MVTRPYQRFEGYESLKGVLEGSVEDALVRLHGQPALIRLPGTDARPRARLVACLLHGNEDSGFRAVVQGLRAEQRYPFDLWVFIGNTRAAAHEGWFAHRYLDDEEDLNRVWGVAELSTPMRRCAAAVLDELAHADLEAAVDLHNNTGVNPFYAIVPDAGEPGLRLAGLCADVALLWRLRAHTLMEALSQRCPAVAVECGLAGVPEHAAYAAGVLQRFLNAAEPAAAGPRPAALFELRYRVILVPGTRFAFGRRLTADVDLLLRAGLDRANFGMLLAGTTLGWVQPQVPLPLRAEDMHGTDVTDRLFALEGRRLVLREDCTPVMMTTAVRQAERDCLFYIARARS